MDNIKNVRLVKEIRQDVAAKEIGITVNKLRQYEAGKVEPDFNVLKSMAKYYNVTVDYLIGYKSTRDEVKEAFVSEMEKRINELAEEITFMKVQVKAMDTVGMTGMLDSANLGLVDIYKHLQALKRLEGNETEINYHFDIEANAEKVLESISGMFEGIKKRVQSIQEMERRPVVMYTSGDESAEKVTEKEIKIENKKEESSLTDTTEEEAKNANANNADEVEKVENTADEDNLVDKIINEATENNGEKQEEAFNTDALGAFLGL